MSGPSFLRSSWSKRPKAPKRDIGERLRELKQEKQQERAATEAHRDGIKEQQKQRNAAIRHDLQSISSSFNSSHTEHVCRFWLRNLLIDKRRPTPHNFLSGLEDMAWTILDGNVDFQVELSRPMERCGDQLMFSSSLALENVRLFGDRLPALKVETCISCDAQVVLMLMIDESRRLFETHSFSQQGNVHRTVKDFKYNVQLNSCIDRKSILQMLLLVIIDDACNSPDTPAILGTLQMCYLMLENIIDRLYNRWVADRERIARDPQRGQDIADKSNTAWGLIKLLKDMGGLIRERLGHHDVPVMIGEVYPSPVDFLRAHSSDVDSH